VQIFGIIVSSNVLTYIDGIIYHEYFIQK